MAKTGLKILESNKTIEKEIKNGGKIILDNLNTNMKQKTRSSIIQLGMLMDRKVVGIWISTKKYKCFFMDNYKSKLEKCERTKDVAIHSYYKFVNDPNENEGFDKIIETDIIVDLDNRNEERLFKQYF